MWSYPGALFLSAGGTHHHLGLNTWAAGAPPAGEADAKLLDWELVLPSKADLDRVRESLESAGAPVESAGAPVESAGLPVESAGLPVESAGALLRAEGSELLTRDPRGTGLRIRASQ